MTLDEASNLLDYEVYARTGSACAARKAAVGELRALAEFHRRKATSGKTNQAWSTRCFKHLLHLAEPLCSEAEQEAAFSRQQLGWESG